MEFYTTTPSRVVDNFVGSYDQAYVLYDMEGPAAFLSFQDNAAQLDLSNCNPIGVPLPGGVHGNGSESGSAARTG